MLIFSRPRLFTENGLVRANLDAEKEDRLDEEELIGQMRRVDLSDACVNYLEDFETNNRSVYLSSRATTRPLEHYLVPFIK